MTTSWRANSSVTLVFEAPWYRYTLRLPSVCSAICCSQFERTETGHTISVALGPSREGGEDVDPT